MNERGQSGWELVSVFQHKDSKGEILWTGFFKRPGAGQTPVVTAQATTSEVKTVFAGQAKEIKEPSTLQGFDLSGDEFELKTS